MKEIEIFGDLKAVCTRWAEREQSLSVLFARAEAAQNTADRELAKALEKTRQARERHSEDSAAIRIAADNLWPEKTSKAIVGGIELSRRKSTAISIADQAVAVESLEKQGFSRLIRTEKSVDRASLKLVLKDQIRPNIEAAGIQIVSDEYVSIVAEKDKKLWR